MGKYRIIPSAKKDIEEILVYIAGNNLDAALSLDSRLTDIFEMLADNTEAGRGRDQIRRGDQSRYRQGRQASRRSHRRRQHVNRDFLREGILNLRLCLCLCLRLRRPLALPPARC